MISFIVWTILLYLLYRFIFGFLIPVIGASRQMRIKIRQMQEQMNQRGAGASDINSKADSDSKNTSASPKTSRGDYIDFEELK